ncbi:mei2 [Symbiodinium sp. CCMP2592]|nr:mei2 [Symbiodinium sp. CCMP2592]
MLQRQQLEQMRLVQLQQQQLQMQQQLRQQQQQQHQQHLLQQSFHGGAQAHNAARCGHPAAKGSVAVSGFRVQERQTTVMLRNLPQGYSRDMLVELMNRNGFHACFDFVYIPINFRSQAMFGYAFVNFVDEAQALRARDAFEGFTNWGVETDKICEVSWSDMHQGLMAHVNRYRSSPVMHESVPDEYKPAVYSQGRRVPFPAPTKRIRVPRIRRGPEGAQGEDGDDGEGSEGVSICIASADVAMQAVDEIPHPEMTMALQEWMRPRAESSNTPPGTKDEGLFAAFRDPAVPANFKLHPLQILTAAWWVFTVSSITEAAKVCKHVVSMLFPPPLLPRKTWESLGRLSGGFQATGIRGMHYHVPCTTASMQFIMQVLERLVGKSHCLGAHID